MNTQEATELKVTYRELHKLRREFNAMAETFEEMEHCVEDHKIALANAHRKHMQ